MKKRMMMLLACLLVSGCATTKDTPKSDTTKQANYCSDEDASKGCGIGGSDMSDYEGFTDKNNVFQKLSMKDAIEMFEKQQSAVFYFGYPGCPWCVEALPILDETAKAHKQTVFYIQTRDENKKLLYTEDEKQTLLPYLDEFLEKDKQGEKQLFVPMVVVVKDGKAMSAHTGTVDGHDAHERKLKDAEKKELKAIYETMFS